MSRWKPVVFVVLALGFLIAGQSFLLHTGLELHPDSIRRWVDAQGWLAPAIFVAMLACRQFLLIPSGIILSVGGLVFGAAGGTVLGGVGLLLSGLLTFAFARGIGGDWARAHLAAKFPKLERRLSTAGPMLWTATAYPAGPMTAVLWASACSSMRMMPLFLAVATGSLIRAFAFSLFGSSLVDVGSPGFWAAVVLLGTALLVPALHPGLRRWIFRAEA